MIKYTTVDFSLTFPNPISFEVFPTFVFRGVIGRSLKRISCTQGKDTPCEQCILNNNCAYAWFFESHISKDNGVIEGVNKASHPFVIFTDIAIGEKREEITLSVTLIGRGIDYFSYLVLALQRGGEDGIGRDRKKYVISSVSIEGEELEEFSVPQSKIKAFTIDNIEEKSDRKIEIETITPLRIQRKGEILDDIDYPLFLKTVARRIGILEGFYGETELHSDWENRINYSDKNFLSLFERKNLTRYSGRQKKTMDMGGIVGKMKIIGTVSSLEIALLKGGELFHIGKNTGFGLGKYRLNIEGE